MNKYSIILEPTIKSYTAGLTAHHILKELINTGKPTSDQILSSKERFSRM